MALMVVMAAKVSRACPLVLSMLMLACVATSIVCDFHFAYLLTLDLRVLACMLLFDMQ
jgi:hypothetical protein